MSIVRLERRRKEEDRTKRERERRKTRYERNESCFRFPRVRTSSPCSLDLASRISPR
ncbi:hypothetical protein PUN28_014752 [Cardiocondyla obscurior]|uniref:Uncharacterized protein n=1 Tax=Cardiocondyla obscurior TaxID=286306 RepID=A0AAW2EV57_9HYME